MSGLSLSGYLRTGLNSVRMSKLRSFWTMLGIVIGIASVITVVGIGEGIKQEISGQLHHYASNLITVRTSEIRAGTGSTASNLTALSGLSPSGPLTYRDVQAISAVHGLSASAPLTLVSGRVRGDNGAYSGYVIGTSPDLPGLLNQSLSYGTFFGPADDGNNVAVLGQSAASHLFNEDVPLGHSFNFHGQNFIVVGIFNQFAASPLDQQVDFNSSIFIPNGTAENLSNNTAPTYEILASAAQTSQTQEISNRIRSTLNSTHGGQSDFAILTGSQNLAVDNSILNLLTRLIAGVAGISLLVGGIGIMNVMLVSVSERVREIGIRKAVGATNRQILSQFMVEASTIGLAGGLVGVVLSFLIDIGLRATTDLRPSIGWPIVVIATGVALLVGVIFGTVPAVKAARKDPIEALRAE